MVYLSCSFTNLFKVHPVACIHSFVVTIQHTSQTFCIFFLVLAITDLIRSGRQVILSSHMYPDLSSTVGIPPILFVYFNNMSNPTPWNFGKILEGSALILGVSAQFLCVQNFSEELQSCLRTYSCFPCEISWGFCSNIIGFLRSCLWFIVVRMDVIVRCHSCGDFSWSLFSLLKGDPNVLEELLFNCKWCPGKFSSWLLV